MIIELIEPHEKQKEIINACLDPAYFFVVAVIGRQFGKTTIAENLAIFWALNEPGSIIYWVSPTDSQSQKVYKEIVNAIIESGVIRSKKMPKGDIEIVFQNQSKILFRSAASEDSLRGQSVDYMILDEAAFIKRDTVETILLPMLNVRGKKCLFISTPKGKNYLHDYYLKGKKDPNWKSLRFSTFDSPLANKELIEMFRETLPDKLFQQEVMAEFVDNASIFNNLNDVMILTPLNEPRDGAKYWAGVDIGLIQDATVLSIMDEEGNLVKYFRWVNIESPDLVNEIYKLNSQWKFKKVMIESNNQGLPIIQELKRRMSNISEFNTNASTKPQMINRLIHLFNMKEIKTINDDYLKTELEAFIFKQTNTGRLQFMADWGFHDDCVMSLAIARWCWENNRYNAAFAGFYNIKK